MFPLLVGILTVRVLIFFFLPIQDRFHWLLLVGVTVGFPISDFNDGVSLNFP